MYPEYFCFIFKKIIKIKGEKFNMKCSNCKKECMESELENGLCYECVENYKKKNNISNPSITLKSQIIKNNIAQKYKSIIHIMWFLGYGLSIILAITGIVNDEPWLGITIGLIGFIITSYSTLSLEAKAEIIQLLEDIKNK